MKCLIEHIMILRAKLEEGWRRKNGLLSPTTAQIIFLLSFIFTFSKRKNSNNCY